MGTTPRIANMNISDGDNNDKLCLPKMNLHIFDQIRHARAVDDQISKCWACTWKYPSSRNCDRESICIIVRWNNIQILDCRELESWELTCEEL
jgi:hypothetical protein